MTNPSKPSKPKRILAVLLDPPTMVMRHPSLLENMNYLFYSVQGMCAKASSTEELINDLSAIMPPLGLFRIELVDPDQEPFSGGHDACVQIVEVNQLSH